MKKSNIYLMENSDEALRLDIKTNPEAIQERARWCGIGPGARVLDVGCGSGKTSSILHDLVQPDGQIVGIDYSDERIRYAVDHFGNKGIDFKIMDFNAPLDGLEKFDFIWIQFLLEYFRKEASDIIKKLTFCLKPDGHLCLLDLDYNSLNHYQLPENMESILLKIIKELEKNHNFDPFVGRKLYSYLYDIGYRDIQVHVVTHHLIYGNLKYEDNFNWTKKLELAAQLVIDVFDEYPGGYDCFFSDFKKFFNNPRRFSYTPLMICKGMKPYNSEQ